MFGQSNFCVGSFIVELPNLLRSDLSLAFFVFGFFIAWLVWVRGENGTDILAFWLVDGGRFENGRGIGGGGGYFSARRRMRSRPDNVDEVKSELFGGGGRRAVRGCLRSAFLRPDVVRTKEFALPVRTDGEVGA